jgi:DNA repair photolyase
VQLTQVEVRSILTRTSGFLASVCSHSLQPYCGCALGHSLCGVGCYVRHNGHLTKGREWGDFVEIRTNAAETYIAQHGRESAWARNNRGQFGIFLSSSTEPFQPVERKARVTRSLLAAMLDRPPDFLILQSHSHHVADYLDIYGPLAARTALRFHISIESDRDRLPGLPPSASSVAKRMDAAHRLRQAGFGVVVTVSPLLPIDQPNEFFRQLRDVADAVVIDHFIGGDGSVDASRTRRTALPAAMASVLPMSITSNYRDEIVRVAKEYFPGAVGVHIDGFAGRFG